MVMSAWEGAAVALAITYLLLAIRQNAWCWPAAIGSAAIYLVLMFQAQLYMQSVLQVFYMAMAAFGLWSWRPGDSGPELKVTRWPLKAHGASLASIVLPGLVTGYYLAAHSDAAFPYLDALTAWGAIVTTWMVARKILQNWHYWFVIDCVLIYLYANQGLWLTAGLFGVYLVLIVFGYREWKASMVTARG